MRSVVLDGSLRGDEPCAKAAGVALQVLRDRGDDAELIVPRELSLAPCSGCFRCWFKTPGVCVTADDARATTEAIVTADLVVVITPVTYGGYSSTVKAVLDRSIGVVSPLLTSIEGETRHLPRYERYPAWVVIGLQGVRDRREAAVFRRLAARNALNLHAPGVAVDVVVVGVGGRGAGVSTPALTGRIERSIADAVRSAAGHAGGVAAKTADGKQPLGDRPSVAKPLPPPRQALMLIGSPRPGRSTSASLCAYLGARLMEAGVSVDTIAVREALETAGGLPRLVEGVRSADLVVVLSPVYVDSLPAPLTRALELVGGALGPRGAAGAGSAWPRLTGSSPGGRVRLQRAAAVVNSGFPEAAQSDTALAICATFARHAAMRWAGGLALGAGATLDGRALDEAGALFEGCRRSLDLTALALAAGESVPSAAVALMARPLVSASVYRDSTDRVFRQLAEKQGVAGRLGDRPYARGRHIGGR